MMKDEKNRKNLYFYKWNRDYLPVAEQSERITCNIRDFGDEDNLQDFIRLKELGAGIFAYLPVLWEEDEKSPVDAVKKVAAGIYAGNTGQLEWAGGLGLNIIGDAGLNVFNSEAAAFFFETGLIGVTASYELNMDVDRFLKDCASASRYSNFDIEILRYGRVPAMVSQYCPLAGAQGVKGSGCGGCSENEVVYLSDRDGEKYPVILESRYCTSTILSRTPLNRISINERISSYKNIIERICVFDESPSFIKRFL